MHLYFFDRPHLGRSPTPFHYRLQKRLSSRIGFAAAREHVVMKTVMLREPVHLLAAGRITLGPSHFCLVMNVPSLLNFNQLVHYIERRGVVRGRKLSTDPK